MVKINIDIIENFISLFINNKKEFFIYKKKNTYNLIVINKNSILNKNRKVD